MGGDRSLCAASPRMRQASSCTRLRTSDWVRGRGKAHDRQVTRVGQEDQTVKKVYVNVLYLVLSAVALLVAAGAPIPWSGSGGGGFITMIGGSC